MQKFRAQNVAGQLTRAGTLSQVLGANVTRVQRLEALKTSLLTEGVQVSSSARKFISNLVIGPLTVHEYPTTGGLTLDLGNGVLVNAPVDEWFTSESPNTVDLVDGESQLIIDTKDGTYPVEYRPHLPGYLGQAGLDGAPITDVVFSHADRVRLSPIRGCAYVCDYCSLPSERYGKRELDVIINTLEIALEDSVMPPRHVLVSGGSPGRRDLEWFLSTIEAIADRSPLPVDVMMSAVPDGESVVTRLVDSGVVGFAVNLELFGSEASGLHIRGKHRFARPCFDEFVAAAVAKCGSTGAVRSLIVAGLEPDELTLAGVAHVTDLGADPVLSPFRPDANTTLATRRPPSSASMLTLLEEARRIVDARGVRLGPDCVPCQHNTLTFPWDVRSVA